MILHGECGAFNSLLLDCLRAVAEQMQAELDGEFYIQKKSERDRQNYKGYAVL